MIEDLRSSNNLFNIASEPAELINFFYLSLALFSLYHAPMVASIMFHALEVPGSTGRVMSCLCVCEFASTLVGHDYDYDFDYDYD